jgi:hypothetical protein
VSRWVSIVPGPNCPRILKDERLCLRLILKTIDLNDDDEGEHRGQSENEQDSAIDLVANPHQRRSAQPGQPE